MQKDTFGEKRHTFTLADQRKGGQSKSLNKKLALQFNSLKSRKTITKKLAEKMEIEGADVDILKNILLLASDQTGRVLLREMADTLVVMKDIIDDEPSLEKYNLYLQRLFDYKRAVWGEKLTIESDDRKQLLQDFRQRLEIVEKD